MTPEESELRDLAALGGWTELPSVIKQPLVFCKGDKHVWAHSQGATCAELTGDGVGVAIRYRNHRYYPTLADAIGKES